MIPIIIMFITSKTVGFIQLNAVTHSLDLLCGYLYNSISQVNWKEYGRLFWKFRKYSLPTHHTPPEECLGSKHIQSSLNSYAPSHIISTCIDLEVMWNQEVTYSSVLKFFITLGSASAVTPSSPIPIHWYLSHSILVEWRISTSQQ